jgi:tetratricopeptide (TPR) repeat protein
MRKTKKKKDIPKAGTFSDKAAQKAFPSNSPASTSFNHPVDLNNLWTVMSVCLFLSVIVWSVFGQTVHYPFVNYDDIVYVYENPTVTKGLSLEGVKWAFTHTVVFNWHPLTMLSHMLDCQLYGLNAGGHHLTNVLLHTACVIFLFIVLREMTGKLWRSAMVAAIFAIHPLRVESVAWVSERKDVLSGLFFMLTLLTALIFCARAQTSIWKNSESLWTHTLARTSNNALAEGNLGNTLRLAGRVDEAIPHFERALQYSPRFALAENNLALALLQTGHKDEAIDHFQQALLIAPDDLYGQNNLGCLLFSAGRGDEAIVHFQKAVQINPDDAETQNNLAAALLSKGRVDEAIAHYQKAVQINPDMAGVHLNLAEALLQAGREQEAIVHYKKMLQLDPHSWKGQNELAWVLATDQQATLRDGNLAVKLAEQANEAAGGQNPAILRTLAAADAEAGLFDDAIQNAQKAKKLAQAAGQSNLVEQLNDQLNLYTAKLPFHQDGKWVGI